MGTCLLVLNQHRLRIFKWEADKNVSSTLPPSLRGPWLPDGVAVLSFCLPFPKNLMSKFKSEALCQLISTTTNYHPFFLPGLHHLSGKGSKHPCISSPRVGARANRKSVCLINFYKEPGRTKQEWTGLGWHFLPGYSITFNSSPKHKSITYFKT